MNNVVLSGRLTKNAEVRYGGEDGSVAIARFTLAVQDYKGTDFINIRALGKQAEWVEKWTSKGTKVELTGKIRGLYQDIDAGMITKMSWAFVVAEDSYDRETRTRNILKIKKVYDVSAVSIPANSDTTIAARDYVNGRREIEQRETLERRRKVLEILAQI